MLRLVAPNIEAAGNTPKRNSLEAAEMNEAVSKVTDTASFGMMVL